MTLSIIAPIMVMFFIWGIKPGPHTITLVLRSISHGIKHGFAIAIGNNICHILYFSFAFYAIKLFEDFDFSINIARILSAIYIISYCIYDFKYNSFKIENSSNKKGILEDIVLGFIVGLINPLNVSFYIGIVPGLIALQPEAFQFATICIIVFISLIAGQVFYIFLAEIFRGLISNVRIAKYIQFAANLLFFCVGIYIIQDATKRLIVF